MKFMISFSMPMETLEERSARFLETGGAPPAGVTMEARWHSVSGAMGWVMAETDDAQALYKWIGEWADVVEFQVDPVIGDAEAAEVLRQRMG